MEEILSRAEYGVYLLTCAVGEEINGMPLSLFMQVSFSPPLVLVGVSPKRYTHKMIEESKKFAVIFLRKDQRQLVDKFKAKDIKEKFKGLAWKRGITGAPILEDCLGWIECELREKFSPGDHTLFIGEVIAGKLVGGGKLLLISDLGKFYKG